MHHIYNESRHDASKIKNLLSVRSLTLRDIKKVFEPTFLKTRVGSLFQISTLYLSRMTKLKSKINRLRIQIGMTSGDLLIFLFICFSIILFFFILPHWIAQGGKFLEIRAGDKIVGTYALNKEQHIEVAGKLGTTLIVIENGRARIKSSPCPHKICCGMGEIGDKGGILVCVPNQVIVGIAGERAQELDAVSR